MGRTRRPAGLWVITLAGLVTGKWLVVGGLFLRIFGEDAARDPLPWIASLSFGPNLFSWLSINTQGWLRLVIGLALFGAVMGMWLRQTWAVRSTKLLAAFSLLFLGVALVTAPTILIWLSLPSTISWFQPVIDPDARSVPA